MFTGMSSSKKNEVDKIEDGENLENFIVNELQRQRQQDNDSTVDDDRAAAFIQRAIKESQRMNSEVQKSAEKRAAVLKASNSSAEQMMQWTCEHADEVLTKQTLN